MIIITPKLKTTLLSDSPFNNPFSFDFDTEKIKSSNDWDKNDFALLEIIGTLNELFLKSYFETNALMSSCNYSPQEIFNDLMILGNRHIVLLHQRMQEVYGNSSGVLDFERLREIEVQNGFGQSENAVDSSEILIDLYSMLFNYQNTFEWLEVDPEGKDSDNDLSREQVIQRLVLYINIVFNARIVFHSIVHSEVEVSQEEDGSIKLGPDPDGLSWITAANEIRTTGRFNELYFPLTRIKSKQKVKVKIIDHTEIEDEKFSLILREKNVEIMADAQLVCQMQIFYPYLMDIRLNAFKDVMLIDLLKLLNKLSEIVQFFCTDSEKQNLTLVNPPFRIKKELLYQYLAETADIGKDIVILFLSSLISKEHHGNDLYRYPLMEDDHYFILFFPALNAPKPHPFVERWLETSEIKEIDKKILFRDFVKKELKSNKPPKNIKLQWQVIESLAYHELLAIETRDFFIILDFICPEYTINQAEERTLLKKYDEIYKGRAQLFSDFSDELNTNRKRILKVCITSDLHYSGLKVGGIPLLDIILFKNYLIVGKYQRVKLINHEQKSTIKDLFDLPYYLDENEFELGLPGFIDSPIPIRVLTSKMKAKYISIFPKGFEFSVIQTVSQLITEEEEEILDLNDLDGMLKSQYFLNEENTRADRMINSLISKLFAKIADTQRGNLSVVEELISSIKISKRISTTHLVSYLVIMVSRMKSIPIAPDEEFVHTPYEIKNIDILLNKCLPDNKSVNIQLSTFKLHQELSENERKQLFTFLTDTFAGLAYRNFDLDQSRSFYMQIILLSALIKDDPEYNRFFLVVGNFVENLNLNHHYQIAREISQEIWAFAAQEKRHIHGLNILFKCFIKQKNILYSSVYGGILISAADSCSKMEKALYVDILFNLMRFFREFSYTEFVKMTWKFSKTLKLNTYDDQKFSIAYFNTRLSLGLKEDEGLQIAVVKYIKKNIRDIVTFGDMGITPWLGLCLNITRLCNIAGITLNNQIPLFIEMLEKKIEDNEIIKNLKYQVEGISTDLKKQFIQSLEKVFDDECFDDYKYDIGNFKPIADNTFLTAIDKKDDNLLLLTSFVYNDQRLSFVNMYNESKVKLFGTKTRIVENLENYSAYIINGLDLSDRQIFVWLLELNGNVYRVVISINGLLDVKQLTNWNPVAMNHWIRSTLPKFYFNSQKNRYYDFMEQENFSHKLIADLSNFDLLIDQSFSEILILKSIDMSSYPDNLLINNGKLISSKIPICNILNLEHFISNHQKIELSLDKINAWLPIEGGDATINFGFNEMEPLLKQQGANIIFNKIIEKMPTGDINVFLAHGTTDLDGFKYFQADDNSFHYQTNIFGNGTIAILFICSSGNLHEDFLSQDIRSIGQDLIQQGYSSVIAPFW
ncbi:hypothetical protein KO02_13465 [Sphingobacterium sp. ML3W]|uniref:hypothetical protein n=1 Tax=Sphingobacterium sp. ML3W TaxID=1538644 RepID=UPI0004F8229F|nr:hypothetical protein [Sphingobacterium sp. ML3W]AIM37582.1 hypothetical protein KO02_13465 [Sphingobacterium sp. ML3W]